MIHAILRGFDVPARNTSDQLRLCNPLVSFEEGDSAPIYFVRDLDWSPEGKDRARWFTALDTDEIETFATLVPRTTLQIHPGDGIVLIGERICTAARSLAIVVDHDPPVEFTEHPRTGCRIGVAGVDTYRKLRKRLTDEAASIFDGELKTTAAEKLTARAETALFLLRKCGFSLPTVIAIRQLAATRVTRQLDRHRRLLTRFSRELDVTEDILDGRVDRHLRYIKDEGSPTSRPKVAKPSGKFPISAEFSGSYSVFWSQNASSPALGSKHESEDRPIELRQTSTLHPRHPDTILSKFMNTLNSRIRTPISDPTLLNILYGTRPYIVPEEYEIPTSSDREIPRNPDPYSALQNKSRFAIQTKSYAMNRSSIGAVPNAPLSKIGNNAGQVEATIWPKLEWREMALNMYGTIHVT